jgi:hypothetical protein
MKSIQCHVLPRRMVPLITVIFISLNLLLPVFAVHLVEVGNVLQKQLLGFFRAFGGICRVHIKSDKFGE